MRAAAGARGAEMEKRMAFRGGIPKRHYGSHSARGARIPAAMFTWVRPAKAALCGFRVAALQQAISRPGNCSSGSAYAPVPACRGAAGVLTAIADGSRLYGSRSATGTGLAHLRRHGRPGGASRTHAVLKSRCGRLCNRSAAQPSMHLDWRTIAKRNHPAKRRGDRHHERPPREPALRARKAVASACGRG